jgi:hypothetical protein
MPFRVAIRRLWTLNIVLLVFTILAGVLTDSNGRLLGLDEPWSVVTAWLLTAGGFGLDCILGWYDRKRWTTAATIGVVYAILLILLVPELILVFRRM